MVPFAEMTNNRGAVGLVGMERNWEFCLGQVQVEVLLDI